MPIFGSEHRETSITVKINQFTQPHRETEEGSLELHLHELIDLIQIQPNSGALEAARAIRKKIKYGSVSEQLLALKLLGLLVINSGDKIGGVIANDDKLISVLTQVIKNGPLGTAPSYSAKVTKLAKLLAITWHEELQDLPQFKPMADLYKILGKSKKDRFDQDRFDQDRFDQDVFDDGIPDNFVAAIAPSTPSGSSSYRPSSSNPSSSSSRAPPRPTTKSPFQKTEKFGGTFGEVLKDKMDKKKKKDKKKEKKKKVKVTKYADEQYAIPQINYDKEAPKIRSLIADCYTQINKLDSMLSHLSPNLSPLNDSELVKQFDKCKSIRRKILKYIQYVGIGNELDKSKEVINLDMEFLGSLLNANEKLVEIFKKFDSKCGYDDENKAPEYGMDVSSDESYYTSDEDEEEEFDDEVHEEVTNASDRLQNLTIQPPVKLPKVPPPRPLKPPALSQKQHLQKSTTNDSDPFGDGHEVVSKYL